jgi:hypothetical protein
MFWTRSKQPSQSTCLLQLDEAISRQQLAQRHIGECLYVLENIIKIGNVKFVLD